MNILYRSRLSADYQVINTLNIGAVAAAAAAAVAGAAISAGVSAANASSAKGAASKATSIQQMQNEENKRLAAQARDLNNPLFDQARDSANGYVSRATNYAINNQNQYAGQGGRALDKLGTMMGINGPASQAEADATNKTNAANYQKQLAAYNTQRQAQLADYKTKMQGWNDQQAKRKEIENWYNSVGGQATGMSLDQVYNAAGAADPGAMPAWAETLTAPTQAEKAVYDPNYNSLNQGYGAEQYQQDPTYTPLVSNNLTRDQYSKMSGVTPFTSNKFTADDYAKLKGMPAMVSNTLSQDEYAQTPGYTPMVNTLAELEATPGYKVQYDQGMKALQNSQAARGGLLSGRALKEANNYAQGQASTGFQSAWERGQKAYADAFSRKQQQFQEGQDAFQNAYNRNTLEYNQGLQDYGNEYDRQSQRYAQGQDAYSNAYNRYRQQQDQQYNRLYGLSGMGQNAATNQSGYSMTGAALNSSNDLWAAEQKAQQNTNYAASAIDSGKGYADTASNAAIANAQANNARNTAIGNSLTSLAGAYASYRTPGSGAGYTNSQPISNSAFNDYLRK